MDIADTVRLLRHLPVGMVFSCKFYQMWLESSTLSKLDFLTHMPQDLDTVDMHYLQQCFETGRCRLV